MATREAPARHVTISWCLLFAVIFGCVANTPPVKIVVSPQVPKPAGVVNVLLEGQIVFDGNQEYVPRTIGQKKTEPTTLIIRYEYDDVQQRHEIRAPVYLLNNNQPAGMKTATVFGRLTILDGEKTLKTYEAVALLSTPIENGQTMTAMRKQGLFAIRDSIEGQMYEDSVYLRDLRK